ncbi:MAG: peptidylprolyl isomerase [Vallitalea sp.]|jgi:foldase protein PrsA|nr:peptidylprolyl isomerase [Vallitalea sp.]
MKKAKHFILGFISATLLLTCIISVSANDLFKEITAQVSYEIKMMLNGKEFNPKEDDGTELKPIVYNDRTYLPVRTLCDAIGVDVKWEGKTKTVLLMSTKDESSNNENEKIVGSIAGKTISLGEVNFYLRQMENYYERSFGPDVWDKVVDEKGKTVLEFVKEDALNNIEKQIIICSIADKRGIKLSDEQSKIIDDYAQQFIKQLGEELANKDGITKEIVKKILTRQELVQAVFNNEMADFKADVNELNSLLEQSDEYKGYKDNGYDYYGKKVRARHILFMTRDSNNEPLSDDKKAEVKAKAEEVLAKANKGEDFVTLVKNYSEDIGSKDKGGEYTFGRGLMVAEFENACFSMKPGEISKLVETVYGYHIIKLEEIIEATEEDINAIKDNEKRIIDSVTQQLEKQAFDKKLEEWKKSYKLEINNEVWDAVEVRQSRNK